MTGIFSNDTYNNGVTRDDFEQYAHTYYNPRDPYNGDYIIPQNNNNNNEPTTTPPPKPKPIKNNNNKKAGILGATIFLAIVIFIILFSFKMYYAAQEINYYQGKVDEAKERIAQLEATTSANFILPQTFLLFYYHY